MSFFEGNFQGTKGRSMLRETWNSTQPTDGMAFHHVIRWQIKNVTVQLSRRLHSLNGVEIHMRTSHYHPYMSRDVITSSLWDKTTKLRENALQNETVPLLHSTLLNHAEVIKLQLLNLCWWKVLNTTGHLIFNYVIFW